MKYFIETYGCQMNVYDSRQMEWLLQAAGHGKAETLDEADLLLLNTCAIREGAEDRIWGQLGHHKRWKEQRQGRLLALCGCMAQNHGEGIFKRAPHVDLVLGSGAVASLPGLIEDLSRKSDSRIDVEFHEDRFFYYDLPKRERPPVSSDTLQYPVFVPIMRGCNYRCTYCIVPRVRGEEVYRPVERVCDEVRDLVEQGYREVTLIGQTVNSYEVDGVGLDGLLREVAKIQGIDRIRFTTSHPRNFTSALIDSIAEEEKVCEHVHLPVQSGSDRVLKRMARRYTADEYRRICSELREKVSGVSITTDLIIGFPGETEEDFQATMDLMRDVQWEGSFIFKYSPRELTAATRLPDPVPDPVMTDRFKRILDLQMQLAKQSNEQLLQTSHEVLIEDVPSCNGSVTGDKVYKGRTRTNKMVVVHPEQRLSTPRFQVGDLVSVKVTNVSTYTLHGYFSDSQD